MQQQGKGNGGGKSKVEDLMSCLNWVPYFGCSAATFSWFGFYSFVLSFPPLPSHFCDYTHTMTPVLHSFTPVFCLTLCSVDLQLWVGRVVIMK